MHRTRSLAYRAHRGARSARVITRVAGQCFEITLRHESQGWVITVPEINETTEAATRAEVEVTARHLIARSTGIPLGYISVWVRD
jgi:hypothetical protein